MRYRTDKAGIIHASIGKRGFRAGRAEGEPRSLAERPQETQAQPAKGVYMQKVTVSSTMGPGVSGRQASLAR